MDATAEAWTKINRSFNAESEEKMIEAFTERADSYDYDLNALVKSIAPDALVQNSLRYIKNDESALLLDLAAGTGRCGEALREFGYRGKMDALDANAAMLKKAEEKGIYRKIICSKVMVDEPLPVKDKSYDAATIVSAIYPNQVQPEALTTMLRCLKPGGFLLISTRNTDVDKVFRTRINDSVNELISSGKADLVEVKDTPRYEGKNDQTATIYIIKKL